MPDLLEVSFLLSSGIEQIAPYGAFVTHTPGWKNFRFAGRQKPNLDAQRPSSLAFLKRSGIAVSSPIYGVASTLSCFGHFHAYQTISERSTTSTIVANI